MSKLIVPKEMLLQHAIWLGKTGSGKSSALRHVVEWLSAQGKRICIIDPKGDWWGVKFSADGKAAGLGERVGVDPNGGHFGNVIGPLGTIGLIERQKGKIAPTEILFPKGIR